MTSQSSDDPDDVTLGEEDQEELRDTLTGHGLAPTAQDPDEDEAYTPTQDEERSWQTFEQNPLRSMYGLADDMTRHETPLRLARPSQATKISKPNRFAYPSRSRPRGVYRPLWLIWHRPRHLVIEIRQIWGWCPPPSLHKSLHPSLYL